MKYLLSFKKNTIIIIIIITIMVEELNMSCFDEETKQNIIEYLENLNEIELKALKIAIEHLKSSFNITKSNGFKDFMKKKH